MSKEPLTSKEMLDKVYWRLTCIERMIPEMQDSEIIELRRWIEEKWQERSVTVSPLLRVGGGEIEGVIDDLVEMYVRVGLEAENWFESGRKAFEKASVLRPRDFEK